MYVKSVIIQQSGGLIWKDITCQNVIKRTLCKFIALKQIKIRVWVKEIKYLGIIKMSATIELYELVNRERLLEVLNCSNLPCESTSQDDGNCKKKENLLTLLTKYSKLKWYKNKGYKIVYKQNSGFGRYNCSRGLQTFKREIRKYLCQEYYTDIDFVNCHPTIIYYLLK